MFDKTWFRKHQRLLVWLANTFLGKLIFGFHLNQTKPGQIIGITPNSVHWIDGRNIKSEFLCVDFYSYRISKLLYFLHAWDMFWYPRFNLGFDSLEVNSNAGGDGGAPHTSVVSYALVHDATASTSVQDTNTTTYTPQNQFDGLTYYISRGFWPFDTSALPASPTISAAVLSFYIDDVHAADTDSVAVVQSTQASNTALVVEDYDQIGSTSGGSITFASITVNQYNDIALNATGISWISDSGFTKLATRTLNDLNNVTPTGRSDCDVYTADNASNKPKLVITYTTGGVAFFGYKNLTGVGI